LLPRSLEKSDELKKASENGSEGGNVSSKNSLTLLSPYQINNSNNVQGGIVGFPDSPDSSKDIFAPDYSSSICSSDSELKLLPKLNTLNAIEESETQRAENPPHVQEYLTSSSDDESINEFYDSNILKDEGLSLKANERKDFEIKAENTVNCQKDKQELMLQDSFLEKSLESSLIPVYNESFQVQAIISESVPFQLCLSLWKCAWCFYVLLKLYLGFI